MDNWERFILYRKKLLFPHIYQMVDWFSWFSCLAAILFLGAIVYRYGFTFTENVHSVVSSITHAVWIIFLINTTLGHLFSSDSTEKFTVWTWVLDIGLYLTLLPVVFNQPEPGNMAYWIWMFFNNSYYKGVVLLLMSFTSGVDFAESHFSFVTQILTNLGDPQEILCSSISYTTSRDHF